MDNSKKYTQNVISIIESIYDNLTSTEKIVADYFINFKSVNELSAKEVADHIHVSESSLSRFAQKCGFSGYREFSFRYKEMLSNKEADKKNTELSTLVIDTYQDLLSKSYSMVDLNKIKRICDEIQKASMIYTYGVGNSSNCADEFKLRFMRFGFKIVSESNHHTMRIQASSMSKTDLVIGISISGKTREVIESLKTAKKNNARTILITSNDQTQFQDFCDEILFVAVKKNLDEGRFISPQFPVLIMLDLLFAHFLNYSEQNIGLYTKTISEFKKSQIDYKD